MAEEVGRLEVVLDARLTQFERKVEAAEKRLLRLANTAGKGARDVESATARMVDRGARGFVTRVCLRKAHGAGFTVRGRCQ
jgi:hypothetical protein